MWKFLVSCFFIVSPLFSESYLNNSSYIAQRGFGETEQIAQESAFASLSKYFQMNVSVEAEERIIVKDSSSKEPLINRFFSVFYLKMFFLRKYNQRSFYYLMYD